MKIRARVGISQQIQGVSTSAFLLSYFFLSSSCVSSHKQAHSGPPFENSAGSLIQLIASKTLVCHN